MMSSILVKIFATALTLSQITTQPDDMQTRFDPQRDRQQVAELLRAGCRHLIHAFGLEDINLDELIETAMQDPEPLTSHIPALRGVDFFDLHLAFREYCKDEKVEASPVSLEAVIDYYNQAVADLPDHSALKGIRLPSTSLILDANGERFTEVYKDDNRRIWVPLSDIPDHVRKAFIAAEDKRFYQHRGVDERGLIRAFLGNFQETGRPQGGSTITQQVAKNLLVGDDVTYERKIREMIVAARLERVLTKDEIVELYLNHLYLGRASWGVVLGAQSYFGNSL
jgi:penicillin-binding protein 1A